MASPVGDPRRRTDTYAYASNGTGNSPLLDSVTLGATLGTRDYTWGAAGHLEAVDASGNLLDFASDDDGRLSSIDRATGADVVSLRYDGRSFLADASVTAGGTRSVSPIYDSSGMVHALRRLASPTSDEELVVFFYLAGRPVAQVEIDETGAETWTYLTTDHLGTPLVATNWGGSVVWEGSFEPFGRDWQAGTTAGAAGNGVFLRFPGQWEDGTWKGASSGVGLFDNVFRWYDWTRGAYTRPDPYMDMLRGRLYDYVEGNPLVYVDPFGLHKSRWPHGGPYHYLRPPEGDLDCVLRITQRIRQEAGGDNRYLHCMANCLISKQCPGGKTTAVLASFGKELGDVVKCLALRRDGNCDSAFQPADFEDNETGRACPEDISCSEHCAPLRRQVEPPPGPFERFKP